MGTANCPLVAPDRFTRPGILPGVLVVTLPVVEGDVAFLQGHALAVEQRQTGRTQGIIAPSSHLVPCCSPFWASHLLRSAIRSLPAPAGAVKTSVHQQAQPRFMVLSLAEAQRQGLPIWPTATMVSLVWLTRARALGEVVQFGRGLLHHLAEGGTDIGRAALLWKRYHFSANHVRNILDGARAAFTLLTVETGNNARKECRQPDSRR